MSRIEKLTFISSRIETLDEERISVLAELLQFWSGPSVYAELTPEQKTRIESALDRLDRGESRSAEMVFSELQDHLAASDASGGLFSTPLPRLS